MPERAQLGAWLLESPQWMMAAMGRMKIKMERGRGGSRRRRRGRKRGSKRDILKYPSEKVKFFQ